MDQAWRELIISICSIILTGLATWAVAAITNWLNQKLKDKKSKNYALEAFNIVTACVKATYQTYVEAIKGTDAWTKEAQETALNLALESAKAQLNDSIKEYICSNYGSLDAYLIGLIEAVLYDLKKE